MVAPKRNDVIFDYTIIEAGCSDNPGVRIEGVQISEGLMYLQKVGCHCRRAYIELVGFFLQSATYPLYM